MESEEIKDATRDEAATKIQAVFKGYSVRKEYLQMKQPSERSLVEQGAIEETLSRLSTPLDASHPLNVVNTSEQSPIPVPVSETLVLEKPVYNTPVDVKVEERRPASRERSFPSSEKAREFVTVSLQTVLTEGLTNLCKTKPSEPLVWLANWLLTHNPNRPQVLET